MVAEVFLYSVQLCKWYVLLGKRGDNVPDYKGFWGLPCGYLDWNESLYEAMEREVWEETGLWLTHLALNKNITSSTGFARKGNANDPLPWKISDKSLSDSQNVSFHFGILACWRGDALPKLTTANCTAGEAMDAQWIELNRAASMDLAFKHQPRLKELLVVERERFESISSEVIKNYLVSQD